MNHELNPLPDCLLGTGSEYFLPASDNTTQCQHTNSCQLQGYLSFVFSIPESVYYKPAARLALSDLDAPLDLRFLDHLEQDQGSLARRQNNRLAAMKFFEGRDKKIQAGASPFPAWIFNPLGLISHRLRPYE
jgi:hypothetical protein